MRRRAAVLFVASPVLLILAATAAISVGTAAIPFDTVWAIVLDRLSPGLIHVSWPASRASIVWELRVPRAILAILVGAGLGMAGTVMQGVTRNPLADPHLLGVSAGAALGANVAILLTGHLLGPYTVPLFAFGGAMAATGLVILTARFAQTTGAAHLVLAGVATAFVVGSLGNVLIVVADPRAVASVVFWMLGGFGFAQWGNLGIQAAALLGCGLVFLANARQLNGLAMGDETATTLGIPVGALRTLLLVTNALLTGVMVAVSGMIGFVGLMMPHIARLMVGGDNRLVLPAAAILGALFLVVADIAARTLAAPNDIPIGVVTGLVGGLCFVWLLRRASRP